MVRGRRGRPRARYRAQVSALGRDLPVVSLSGHPGARRRSRYRLVRALRRGDESNREARTSKANGGSAHPGDPGHAVEHLGVGAARRSCGGLRSDRAHTAFRCRRLDLADELWSRCRGYGDPAGGPHPADTRDSGVRGRREARIHRRNTQRAARRLGSLASRPRQSRARCRWSRDGLRRNGARHHRSEEVSGRGHRGQGASRTSCQDIPAGHVGVRNDGRPRREQLSAARARRPLERPSGAEGRLRKRHLGRRRHGQGDLPWHHPEVRG